MFAPENQWLEDDISFWDRLFSGAMSIPGSVKWPYKWVTEVITLLLGAP